MSRIMIETIRSKLIRLLKRFFTEQQWAFIKRGIAPVLGRGAWSDAEQLRADQLLSGRHAPPALFRSREKVYVAYRPDTDLMYSLYPEIAELSKVWIKANEDRNAGDLPRLYGLILNIRQVLEEGIPGDMAELGVFRGNSAAVLAHYARLYDRRVALFDTFEGFDKRDLVGEDKAKLMEFDTTSLNLVREIVGDQSIHYVQGYFPNSVTDDLGEWQFCVAHIDCDLYEPAKAGLKFFYPRLAPGGLLIVHDYANPYWTGIKHAVDEFCHEISERPVVLADKSGTIMIRKRRILHDNIRHL